MSDEDDTDRILWLVLDAISYVTWLIYLPHRREANGVLEDDYALHYVGATVSITFCMGFIIFHMWFTSQPTAQFCQTISKATKLCWATMEIDCGVHMGSISNEFRFFVLSLHPRLLIIQFLYRITSYVFILPNITLLVSWTFVHLITASRLLIWSLDRLIPLTIRFVLYGVIDENTILNISYICRRVMACFTEFAGVNNASYFSNTM